VIGLLTIFIAILG